QAARYRLGQLDVLDNGAAVVAAHCDIAALGVDRLYSVGILALAVVVGREKGLVGGLAVEDVDLADACARAYGTDAGRGGRARRRVGAGAGRREDEGR